MTEDREDALLLDELAVLLAADHEPPPDVLHAARESFIWRTVDAELAELTHDSLIDHAAAGIRSAGGPRILTFEAAVSTIELEIDETPGGRRLIGQLVPPGPAELELHLADGSPGTRSSADELGRFVIALAARPVQARLRVSLPDGSAVESGWATL